MARTASSSRCWGSALRRESSAGAQVKRRCSWASVSWLPQLELQLGSHFTPQRRCGQGCLTTCCPNTAEGAVELVQLCLVGVQHLGSWLGFEPHLTFSCPNLNKGKLEEKRVRLTTFTFSNSEFDTSHLSMLIAVVDLICADADSQSTCEPTNLRARRTVGSFCLIEEQHVKKTCEW